MMQIDKQEELTYSGGSELFQQFQQQNKFSETIRRQSNSKFQVTNPEMDLRNTQEFRFHRPIQDVNYLKSQADKLLQSGHIPKALEIYHQIISLLEQTDPMSEDCKIPYLDIIKQLCDESMKYLGRNEFEKAIELLHFAQTISNNPLLQDIDRNQVVLVLNNLGCVQRRMGQLQKALFYLEKAQKLITKEGLTQYSGITYLNICAVCSQLGQHEKAQNYVRTGLIECQKQLTEVLSNPQKKFNQKLIKEKARYVAISYHNIAIEEEFVQNYQKCVDYYKEGYETLQKYNGGDDPLVQKLKFSYMKSMEKYQLQPSVKQPTLKQAPRPLARVSSTSLRELNAPKNIPAVVTYNNVLKKQNSNHSFYFKGNKVIATPQGTPQSSLHKKNNYQEDQPQSKMQNFFNEKKTEVKKGSRKISFMKESDLSKVSHEKEMSDLEKMGVLKWSDSEGSDAEDDLMKQQRLNFLKSLNNFDNLQNQQFPVVNNVSQIQQPPWAQSQQSYVSQPLQNNSQIQPQTPQNISQIQPQQPPPQSKQIKKEITKIEKPKDVKKKPQIPMDYDQKEEHILDEKKIIKIQKFVRRRKRIQLGKTIQSVQSELKKQYLAEKLRLKLEEDERLKREEEERRKAELEAMNEQERQKHMDEEFERRRIEDEMREAEEKLAAEDIAIKRAKQEYEDKHARIILKYLRQKMFWIKQKNLIRGPRIAQIYMNRLEIQQQYSVKIQGFFKMILAKKRLQNAIAGQKKKCYKVLLRKSLELKECMNDIFVEFKTCPTGKYVLSFGLKGDLLDYSQASLVIIAKEGKGFIDDGYEHSIQQQYRSDKENKIEITLEFFHKNRLHRKLDEIGCRNLNMSTKNDLLYAISQIIPLLYIKCGFLQIEEITDTEEYNGVNQTHKNTMPFIDERCIEAAQKIQKNFRAIKARKRFKINMTQRFQFIKKWTFNIQKNLESDNYFTIRFYLDKVTKLKYLKGNNNSTRQKTKPLQWYPILQRLYKRLNREILDEILDVNTQENLLQYTDVIKQKLGYEDEGASDKKGYYLPKIDEKFIIKFQSLIRRNNCKSKYKWIKQKKQRKIAEGTENKILALRHQILQNETIYLINLIYDNVKKNIYVTCKILSRAQGWKQHITEYKQHMFEEFSMKDLYFFGPKLLSSAELKITRIENELKIYVKRIEVLISDIKISVKKAIGQEADFMNPTVETRKHLNQNRLKASYQKHKSTIEILQVSSTIHRSGFTKNIGEEYVKGIQKQFRKHQCHRDDHIKKTKDCDDKRDCQDGERNKALEQFAMSVKPTSKIVENDLKLEILEQRRKMEQDGQKLEKKGYSDQGEEVAKDQIVEIRNLATKEMEVWDFDVWYINKYRSIILEGLHKVDNPKIASISINTSLIHYNDFDTKVLKGELKEKIFEFLRYDGRILFFQEEVQKVHQVVQESRKLTGAEQYAKEMSEQLGTSISLRNLNQGDFQIQYSISVQNNVIFTRIVYLPDHKITTEVQFMLEQFDANCIIELVRYKTNEELEKFFHDVLDKITQKFVITLDLTQKPPIIHTNYNKLCLQLPSIFKEVFILKIQRILISANKRKIFTSAMQQLNTKLFFLFSYQYHTSIMWLEVKFFLNKENCSLQMTVQRQPVRYSRQMKKVFAIDLKRLKENMLASGKKGADMENLFFLINNKWDKIEGAHDRHHYFNQYHLLMDYLMAKMTFKILYESINCQCSDRRVPLHEEKNNYDKLVKRTHKVHGKKQIQDQFFYMVKAITQMQQAIRWSLTDNFAKMKKKIHKDRAKQNRQIGERVKRAFQRIGYNGSQGNYYIINIYQKENHYTFDLINFDKRRDSKKDNAKVNKIRGVYEYFADKLLNTKDKTIPEYLLQLLYFVQENEIAFRDENLQNFNNMKSLIFNVETDPIHETQDESIEDATDAKDVADSIKAVSNLVDYVKDKDKLGNERIYNVVYTGRRPKPNRKVQIDEQKQITVNVDLGQLRKLYPTVDVKNINLMQVIGEQLIEGLEVGQKGEVLIDSNKINPHCLEIQNDLGRGQTPKTIDSKEEIKTTVSDFKKIILKDTKFFSKVKFLIIIYIVERKVTKIIKASQDTVFEEFEILYQVNGINFTQKNEAPYIWEVTPEELKELAVGITSNIERARFLIQRIQIFNKSIIFLVDQKEDENKIKKKDNLLVFYERGFMPIQIHYKNRKFRKNFKFYQDEIKAKKDDMIWRGVPDEMQSIKNEYIMACFSKRKMLEFVVWDLSNFEQHKCELDKTPYQKYTIKDRAKPIEIMSRYFSIDTSKNILSCNETAAKDALDKFLVDQVSAFKRSNLQKSG